MRVLFRADASVSIGTGHVMRCATLAEALHKAGVEVAFACHKLPTYLIDYLRARGAGIFSVLNPMDPREMVLNIEQYRPDWLVVDHYDLSSDWEKAMRLGGARRILVIDDLANRPHDCDVLLDQNDFVQKPQRYRGAVPADCQLLLGPKYALLRPEFVQVHAHALNRSFEDVRRVLVFFGGSDPTGETLKALEAVRLLKRPDLAVDVVVGASNPRSMEIQRYCNSIPGAGVVSQVSDMAKRMLAADLAIGAGGTTTWERFSAGLPSVVIAVADNQLQISRALAEAGYQLFLGQSSRLTPVGVHQALSDLMRRPDLRKALSYKARALVDGQGAKRVMDVLLGC